VFVHRSHSLVVVCHITDRRNPARVTARSAGRRVYGFGDDTRRPSEGVHMQARMKNPAMIIPEAMQPIQALNAATEKGGVPSATLALVHLRASQINGCSFCVDSGPRHAKKAGETDERLFAVAAWREAPYFTDAERAALALTEAVTRLADRADPVTDEIW